MKGTQRRTIRKEKNNSAGFTLIEMIVTVAIIAIFSGVVVTLITTGSSLFRGVSGNTKSQVKAQETLDEIEDLIIDANRSIYYAYGSGTDMGTQITSDIDDSNAASKTFIACNEYENGDGTSRYVFDVLDWVGSEGKLYYSQREYTKASSNTEEENENGTGDNSENQQTVDTSGISAESMDNGVAVFASADNDSGNGVVSGGSSDKAKDSKELIARSVFAEGIENFTADVTKVESERIVRFRLTTEENGKKVKTLHTVNLRNRIQVMKPDDAFATASSTDVRINIVGAPDSIDAGKSKILGYNLTGNGSIDPTTLKWEVVDGTEKGYFPELDPTYGKLTINDNATGTVTVIVSAETSDGKQRVTSAPVTIKINNTKTVTGIKTETKSVLVAAGYDGLDLNTAVLWKYLYSDSSEGSDAVSVTWSVNQNCGYASVTSAGRVSVDLSAGTESTGSFEVVAQDNSYGFQGTVTVKIARLELKKPENGKTYYIGDEKELQTVYMEGGVENTEVEPSVFAVTYPSESNGNYRAEEKFQESDVGNWKVKAVVNLSENKRGYGMAESELSHFRVEQRDLDGEIVANSGDGAYAVARNSAYTCGLSGLGQDFSMEIDGLNNQPGSSTKIDWWIEKDDECDASIRRLGDLKAEITVGANGKGFILCAKFTKYQSWNNGTITPVWYEVTAKKYVSVVTDMKITSIPSEVKKGASYEAKVTVTMDNIFDNGDGTYEHYDTFVEEANDSSESTVIDWKGMAANGTMLQWSDSNSTKCKSFTIVETPSMEEDDIVACMWKMKELVKKEINSTAREITFTDKVHIKVTD